MVYRRKQTPLGVRDYLPDELAKRRKLESQIMDVFTKWGYKEVMTPTFEFVDVLASSTGYDINDFTYRFFDMDGELLALRPEMTTPIARLVSTRLKEETTPGRYCYLANVFRHADPQAGHRREFTQAGVEIIGSDSIVADAEAIALCIDCIDKTGLTDFQIHVGHVGFVNGIMDDLKLDIKTKEDIRNLLINQDLVEYRKLVESLSIDKSDKDRLANIPKLRGDSDILDTCRNVAGSSSRALKAVGDLSAIVRHLKSYHVEDKLNIDMGLAKNFHYYTGTVFEGYSSGVGYGICGGGRYDNLLGQFGFESPATGFAMGMERLMSAILFNDPASLETRKLPSCILSFDKQREDDALSDAVKLRNAGWSVLIDLGNKSVKQLSDCYKDYDYQCVLHYPVTSEASYVVDIECHMLEPTTDMDRLHDKLGEVLESDRLIYR